MIRAVVSPPFRIDPVQRERNNGVNVSSQRGFRPGRIDFAAGYIFYIIRKRNLDIGSGCAWRAEMDSNRIGNNHLPQHIGFCYRSFLLALCLHGDRWFPDRNLGLYGAALRLLHRYKGDRKNGCFFLKDRDIRNIKGIETCRPGKNGIAVIRRSRIIWILGKTFADRFQGNLLCFTVSSVVRE